MKLSSTILICLASLNIHAELFFTPKMIATHLETYSDQEIALIEKDLEIVRSISLEGTENTESPFYLATAGAPGARKTTILERFLDAHPEYQKGVYLDPDARALRFMAHTYYAQSLSPLAISQKSDYNEVIKSAYTKWRGASNYITLTLFEEAVAKGRSIVYGTTSTGAHTPIFLRKLKENGYKIILLLCSCPDALRQEAIDYRNKVVRFYQSSPEDAVSKGKFFPERMADYFASADLIYFYWSDDLFSKERLAGIWQNNTLQTVDQEAMNSFIEKYENDRIALANEEKKLPAFEKLIIGEIAYESPIF